MQVCWAKTEAVVLRIPIRNQLVDRELINRAEAMVDREIVRLFSSPSEVSSVEITVLGDSNGEVAPLLTAAVSRSQWETTPQASAWVTYYDSAYQLFQRHQEPRNEIIAGIPLRPAITSSAVVRRGQPSGIGATATRLSPSQIDEAYDLGLLAGRAIQQQYLDDLD